MVPIEILQYYFIWIGIFADMNGAIGSDHKHYKLHRPQQKRVCY